MVRPSLLNLTFATCFLALLATAPAAADNYRWLLKSGPTDSNEFTWDKKSEAVFKQVVPQVKVKNQATPELAGIVRLDLMLPDPKEVQQDRYVVFSGARPHQASTVGLLWLDTQTSSGIFAINECPLINEDENCITIGSKNFSAEKLPAPFIDRFKRWLATQDGATKFPMHFVDSSGKAKPFKLQ